MWKSLPIQTTDMRGEDFHSINKDFNYQRFDNVIIKKWGEVPSDIKTWCKTLWKDNFGTSRTPLNNDDLVAWIPEKGTIAARYGHWIGESHSREVTYINCLYVSPSCRGEGAAMQLILSVCNESSKRWGNSIPFMFEVDKIPQSLIEISAQPICRYSYLWVSFKKKTSNISNWKRIHIRNISMNKGFHGKRTGFRLFQNAIGDKILFDSNDDVVWYTSMMSLVTFDGFVKEGAYCRIFTPFGKSAVFAENMFFTPSYNTHYILG